MSNNFNLYQRLSARACEPCDILNKLAFAEGLKKHLQDRNTLIVGGEKNQISDKDAYRVFIFPHKKSSIVSKIADVFSII